jgi:hypothetical protein
MIINQEFIRCEITNNVEFDEVGDEKLVNVPYRWSHGATDEHLGDGLIIYSLIQFMRAKICVCLGSGGGFIPRIMTQARLDLHSQKIFDGTRDINWGDIGTTFVVDATNGVGGNVNWMNEESFFRKFTKTPKDFIDEANKILQNDGNKQNVENKNNNMNIPPVYEKQQNGENDFKNGDVVNNVSNIETIPQFVN